MTSSFLALQTTLQKMETLLTIVTHVNKFVVQWLMFIVKKTLCKTLLYECDWNDYDIKHSYLLSFLRGYFILRQENNHCV